ncbi:DUF916 domain-containing protein [Arthrobacter wenxiniae]|uniref:DUF916 domain-containing protein n=1 Tax=Arthrobacter wenxiniae TaxID=2713570 RepID=A0A7Y7LZJ9_9MICC|nr:DUF916 domain-containing protein [Arthrobacter wenxiniae]NVM96067.1 DUF916 domain-containing protein [Arthrobacter wenxiniae]
MRLPFLRGQPQRLARLLLGMVVLISCLTLAAVGGNLTSAAAAQAQPVKLSLKPLGQSGSYFSLTMDPGQRRQLQVELGNHGATSIAARTYAADAYSLINGGFGARDRNSPPTGTTRWLSYATQVLRLGPGQGITQAFTLAVPAGTAPGDYISSLVLENDVPIKGSGSVALNQIVRQVIAVSIHVPGPLHPALELGTASHEFTANRSVVGVQVKNPGTTNLKPAGSLTIRDHGGKVVSRAPATMDSVYAHTDTQIQTTLNGKLQPGNYTLAVALSDSATHVHAAETVAFTVEAPRAVTSTGERQGQLPQILQDSGSGPAPYVIGAALLAALAAAFFLRRKYKRRPGRKTGVRRSQDRRNGRPR